jgi:excisionase family DNA binding protein
MPTPERCCYTPKEYAEKRKVSVRTVLRLIRSGKLPAERVGAQWRIWVRTGQQGTTAPYSPNSAT